MPLQGFDVTAYVGAEWPETASRPVGAEKIVKTWAATRDRAETAKRRLEKEYDAIVVIG